jgi:hypothetical protein
MFSFHVSLGQPSNTSARELKEISKGSKAFPRVKLKMLNQAEENYGNVFLHSITAYENAVLFFETEKHIDKFCETVSLICSSLYPENNSSEGAKFCEVSISPSSRDITVFTTTSPPIDHHIPTTVRHHTSSKNKRRNAIPPCDLFITCRE